MRHVSEFPAGSEYGDITKLMVCVLMGEITMGAAFAVGTTTPLVLLTPQSARQPVTVVMAAVNTKGCDMTTDVGPAAAVVVREMRVALASLTCTETATEATRESLAIVSTMTAI